MSDLRSPEMRRAIILFIMIVAAIAGAIYLFLHSLSQLLHGIGL